MLKAQAGRNGLLILVVGTVTQPGLIGHLDPRAGPADSLSPRSFTVVVVMIQQRSLPINSRLVSVVRF